LIIVFLLLQTLRIGGPPHLSVRVDSAVLQLNQFLLLEARQMRLSSSFGEGRGPAPRALCGALFALACRINLQSVQILGVVLPKPFIRYG
jgi:hypothetical protein